MLAVAMVLGMIMSKPEWRILLFTDACCCADHTGI